MSPSMLRPAIVGVRVKNYWNLADMNEGFYTTLAPNIAD